MSRAVSHGHPAPSRLLLVTPPAHVGLAGPQYIDYPELLSLGFVQLAGALRAPAPDGPGYDVHLLDALARLESGVFPRRGGGWLVGAPWGTLYEPIEGADFDVALVHWSPFAAYAPRVDGLYELLDKLRAARPHARVGLVEAHVGGMHHVEVDPEAVLATYPQADFFVRHEAEEVLATADLATLAGAVTGIPAPSLDGLASPAWDLLDAASYDAFLDGFFRRLRRPNPFRVGAGSRPVLFSRGCPYACSFCTSGPPAAGRAGKAYRPLGLGHVAALVDQLQAHGARHLVVLDETPNVRRDFHALLELLLDHGLTFDFPNGFRADHLDRRAVELLARGGATLSVSAESGSPTIQRAVVGKRLGGGAVERAVAWAQELGVPAVVHWIVGLPGEARADARATLAEARRLLDTYGATPLVQYAAPIPGAPLAPEPVAPGAFPDPGWRTAEEPTWLPRGVTRDELVEGVNLLRERARHSRPSKVIVNLTYRCNNHCSFCAVGNRIQEDLPLDEVKRRLLEHRTQGIELLDLDGGEPTLVPHLPELLGWARDAGFRTINVTTNGRLLSSRRKARALLSAGLTELLVSLHGPTAAIHDPLVSAPGAFVQTLAGLDNALELAPPGVSVGVNTTVAKTNLAHLQELAPMLAARGVARWNLQFLTPWGRAEAALVPDKGLARPILADIFTRYGEALGIQVINLPFCEAPPGTAHFLASDIGKLSRRMIFVTREEVNLWTYLAEARVRDEACERCLLIAGCDGHYSFQGPSRD